jgi:hypothetical protein
VNVSPNRLIAYRTLNSPISPMLVQKNSRGVTQLSHHRNPAQYNARAEIADHDKNYRRPVSAARHQ